MENDYTIGDENMEWKEMLGIMLETMGIKRKIITVPTFLATLGGISLKKKELKEGKEPGLDYSRLFKDIQSQYLFFDPTPSSTELGYNRGGIRESIIKTVKACYPNN
jgi:hypothetical protein